MEGITTPFTAEKLQCRERKINSLPRNYSTGTTMRDLKMGSKFEPVFYKAACAPIMIAAMATTKPASVAIA